MILNYKKAHQIYEDADQSCKDVVHTLSCVNRIKEDIHECKFNNDTYFSSEGSIDDWTELKGKILTEIEMIINCQTAIMQQSTDIIKAKLEAYREVSDKEIIQRIEKYGVGYVSEIKEDNHAE